MQCKNNHLLCGVVSGPGQKDALSQIARLQGRANCIEIRADLLHSLTINAIHALMQAAQCPIILTLRTVRHGGNFSGSKQEQFDLLEQLASCFPDYLDVESTIPSAFTSLLRRTFPKTRLICSYHNVEETPNNLESLYLYMRQNHPAEIYKIATYANNCLDGMRLLLFLKQSTGPLAAFCTGHEGSFTRAAAPVLGSKISYASPDGEISLAPGMFSVDEMLHRFRVKSVTKDTSLLSLIGDPIDMSPSVQTHHKMIAALDLDAIYTQIRVSTPFLAKTLACAAQVGFQGLSVTMPHKEEAASLVNAKLGPVNTLRLASGKYEGINTDGKGALSVISRHTGIPGSHIVILGAGGAAQGIAREAIQQGARVTMVNRSAERAERAAKELGCNWLSREMLGKICDIGYDVIVNTIPDSAQAAIDPSLLLPQAVCLETVSIPKETAFFQAAVRQGCIAIPGIEMFLEQAKLQFAWWFDAAAAPYTTRSPS